MLKVLTLMITAFISLHSLAGVRNVGNGGGFGEMKAHLAFQQMDRQVQFCLSLSKICSLTATEAGLLKQVVQNMPAEHLYGGLEFFNDPSLQRSVETNAQRGNVIALNSNLLATPQGFAKPYEEISAYVLYGLLQHVSSNSVMNLQQLAEKVFKSFQERLSVSTFNVSGKMLNLNRIQVLTVENSGVIYEGLMIEDEEKTIDLIEHANLQSLCSSKNSADVRIRSVTSGNMTGDMLVQVNFTCDQKNWGQATLYFALKVDQKGLILLPIESTIRGVVSPLTGE